MVRQVICRRVCQVPRLAENVSFMKIRHEVRILCENGEGGGSKFEGKWEGEYGGCGGCRLAWAVAKNLFLQSIVVHGMLRVIRSVGRHFVVVF